MPSYAGQFVFPVTPSLTVFGGVFSAGRPLPKDVLPAASAPLSTRHRASLAVVVPNVGVLPVTIAGTRGRRPRSYPLSQKLSFASVLVF